MAFFYFFVYGDYYVWYCCFIWMILSFYLLHDWSLVFDCCWIAHCVDSSFAWSIRCDDYFLYIIFTQDGYLSSFSIPDEPWPFWGLPKKRCSRWLLQCLLVCNLNYIWCWIQMYNNLSFFVYVFLKWWYIWALAQWTSVSVMQTMSNPFLWGIWQSYNREWSPVSMPRPLMLM